MAQKDLDNRMKKLLEAVHASAPMMVYDFAGAGVQALAWLHSVGGSSRTVLESTDRYSPRSLTEAVGFEPERFTSSSVAAALAEHALARANILADSETPLFGVGLSATIATDRRKRGEHRCELAIRDGFGLSRYSLTLEKGSRNRREEEALLSHMVLNAVAEACGVYERLELPLGREKLLRHFAPSPPLNQLVQGRSDWVLQTPEGNLHAEPALKDLVLFSGSFNPLHAGHRALAQLVSKTLNKSVHFEMTLYNADKASIDLSEARRRATQFLGFAPLLFTTGALFSQKAGLFPNTTFLVGADTAARILDPRFYDSDEAEMHKALDALKQHGASFLIAGRERHGKFLTLENLAVPEGYCELFSSIDEEAFRMDISSTQLRRS